MGNLTGWHALIILAVVVLIFGAAKLPALAKSVGQSVKILKKEVQTDSSAPVEGSATTRSVSTPSPAATASTAEASSDAHTVRHE
jgi:sec-independent protein translocase protein TatA